MRRPYREPRPPRPQPAGTRPLVLALAASLLLGAGRAAADPPQEVPAPAAPAEVAFDEAPAQPAAPGPGLDWVPVVIFGVVAVPVFLLLLVSLSRKEPPEADLRKGKPAAPRSPTAAPRPAASLPAAPFATSICELPGPGLGRRPRPAEEWIPSVLPARPAPQPRERPPDVIPVRPRGAQLYRSFPGKTPPEVRALGEPERVHPPEWFATLVRQYAPLSVLPGVLMCLGLFGLLAAPDMPDNPFLSGLVFAGIGVGLCFVVLPFFPVKLQTCAVCRDALVLIEDDDFTVIPWDTITQLNAPRSLVTADGQSFALSSNVEGLGTLHETVLSRVAERLLPPMLATLRAGGSVAFGPFRVSGTGIGCEGRMLPWGEVGKMNIPANPGRALSYLFVWKRGCVWPSCHGDLRGLPNGWLFLEVVRRVCPKRLLVADRGRPLLGFIRDKAHRPTPAGTFATSNKHSLGLLLRLQPSPAA
jgi:hypothetical protein